MSCSVRFEKYNDVLLCVFSKRHGKKGRSDIIKVAREFLAFKATHETQFVLCDLTECFPEASIEELQTIRKLLDLNHNTGLNAYVVKSFPDQAKASFYHKLVYAGKPFKVFRDRQNALQWIQQSN